MSNTCVAYEMVDDGRSISLRWSTEQPFHSHLVMGANGLQSLGHLGSRGWADWRTASLTCQTFFPWRSAKLGYGLIKQLSHALQSYSATVVFKIGGFSQPSALSYC
jgi:hypothetical protein